MVLSGALQTKPKQFYGLTQIPAVIPHDVPGRESCAQLKLRDEGRHGLMAVSHKVWDKKLCHGSSSPGHLSPLVPGGITGHFAKTWIKLRSSIAPGAWMKACKVARCCTEKLFYDMLNLSASLETRSTRMIFHAKISEALTKRGHWLFQQGPELGKRKWWWSRVSVKFLTEYPLSSTHTG